MLVPPHIVWSYPQPPMLFNRLTFCYLPCLYDLSANQVLNLNFPWSLSEAQMTARVCVCVKMSTIDNATVLLKAIYET